MSYRSPTWLAAVALASILPAHAAGTFTLTSSAVTEGGTLPEAQVLSGFGCQGGNRSPALAWTNPPTATRSLAITVFDPDAPTGSGWWHWTVFNLPPGTRKLSEGAGRPDTKSLPPGAIQGQTDFGTSWYGGACPPAGDPPHHYVITVWALDVDSLPLDASASGAMVGFLLHQHVIGKAALAVRYGR